MEIVLRPKSPSIGCGTQSRPTAQLLNLFSSQHPLSNMSLDLLEAFGLDAADSSGTRNTKSDPKQAQAGFFADVGCLPTLEKTAASKPAPQPTAPEEDDWGDFEDAAEGGGDAMGFGHKKNAPSTSTRYKYGLDELGRSYSLGCTAKKA